MDREQEKAWFSALRHELRTPVNAILGYSELLLEDLQEGGSGTMAEEIGKIRSSGDALLARINRIMDPAALEGADGDLNASSLQDRIEGELLGEIVTILEGCERHLEELPTEQRKDLDRIRTAARRLRTTIRTIAEPAGEADGAPAEDPAPSPDAGPITPAAAPGGTPAPQMVTILVVDDTPANREILQRRLTRQGYEVSVAENGRQALDMLEQGRFDLILLDIMMPVMNGFEVLERLRKDTLLRNIPVIVISAADDMDSVVKCIQNGAVEFLPKPCHEELLRARIASTLEKKSLRDQEIHVRQQLAREKQRADAVLRAVLPHEVVQELKATGGVQPRRYSDVAVLFCDIVGFTRYCDQQDPEIVFAHLEKVVSAFEEITSRHGLEKIKTIGDAFMATGGLLRPLENPVLSSLHCGKEMVEIVQTLPPHWNARVGIHFGPVVAGIVGSRNYGFDLWGDTVNTASRVESNGLDGEVNVSGAAWQQVSDQCRGESLGFVEVKGKPPLEIIRLKSILV